MPDLRRARGAGRVGDGLRGLSGGDGAFGGRRVVRAVRAGPGERARRGVRLRSGAPPGGRGLRGVSAEHGGRGGGCRVRGLPAGDGAAGRVGVVRGLRSGGAVRGGGVVPGEVPPTGRGGGDGREGGGERADGGGGRGADDAFRGCRPGACAADARESAGGGQLHRLPPAARRGRRRDDAATTPADVTFANQKKLNADNGWTASAKLMTVVDDALAEGDETLVVEGHCTGSRAGAVPSHTGLLSRPLRLTIADNDAPRTLRLSVSPERIGETLGAQAVTVTAAVDAASSSDIAGTRRVVVAAGATEGTARLVLTPSAIREGTAGAHGVSATLTGVPVPTVDVALVLSVGGTATEGASHDYRLAGGSDWRKLTVAANDRHMTASTSVRVSARADALEEGGETVEFGVSRVVWGTTAVALAAPAAATLRITEAWSAPPAPTGLSAVPSAGDGRHGLDLAWDAVAAVPPVDGYVVRYRRVTAPESAWTTLRPRPGLAGVVAGLAAGTRYELRVRARSAAGDGAFSGSVLARTVDGACRVGAPRVSTPSGPRSATELEAAWDAASCPPGAAAARHLVRHREDPAIEGVVNAWLADTASGRTATLSGLTPDTAYVVEVRAVAADGDRGPWSAAGRGRTGLDTRRPPRVGAPTVRAHADRGDERLEATWTRVAWTDAGGVARPIAEYQHRYREAGGAWTEATDARARSEETATMTRTLSGLGSGAWHEAQVRGVNRMGGVAYPGKWSEPGRGRTWGVPDRVEEPSAHPTGSGVVVVWEAPDDGGARIADYDVRYKTSESGGWAAHAYAGCGSGPCATTATIPALAKKVGVRAENAVGAGEWSPTARVGSLRLLRLSFARAGATVAEGTSLLVTARLDAAADRPVSVPLTTLGGSGAFRLDNAANGMIAFGLGTREQTFTLAALQDGDSDDETVTLGFGNLPDGVLLSPPASLVVTIDDDEASNGAPMFAEGDKATCAVAENTAAGGAVGAPVVATDPDGDALAYSLAGADAALFTIDGRTGQIRVGGGAVPDFEGGAASHALMVRVGDGRDSGGAREANVAVDATIAVTVLVSDELEPPAVPAIPTLTPGTTTLAVEWAEPNNTGPRITGYDVLYRAAGAASWSEATVAGTDTTTVLRGLEPGTAHEVRVRAANDEGVGPLSATAGANTLPRVTLGASATRPVIGADSAPARVTLTATVEAPGGGALTAEWLRLDGAETVLAHGIEPTSGTALTHDVSSASPGARVYGYRVRHRLNGRTGTVTASIGIEWRPGVVLSVDPATIREAGGERRVAVRATLTGDPQTGVAKTVNVSVVGGTATAGTDFAEVDNIVIAIPGGARDAAGGFTLAPVVDAVVEGPETVLVTGTATDGAPLEVTGTVVTIDDAAARLTITSPANGYVTGTRGAGASAATVIDCGSGNRSDCAESVAVASVVTLTATADDGYGFSGWTGDCRGSGSCVLTVDADKTVGAAFAALPARPGAPRVTPVDHGRLALRWSAPAGGGGIVGYAVRHRVAGTGAWTKVATGSAATTTTVTGLAAGEQYDVQVRALSAAGGGVWSRAGRATTLPRVVVAVDNGRPSIPRGNPKVASTVTVRVVAARGKLTGRWVRRVGGRLRAVNAGGFDNGGGRMTGGREYSASFSSNSPVAHGYGVMVTHGPNRAHGEVEGVIAIEWVPRVVLGVDVVDVLEGATATVTVTATLTGGKVADVAKTVTVRVGGGTATVGGDFAAVEDFRITIPPGTRSASGSFELAPVWDTEDEDAETVGVGGTAVQGGTVLPVDGTAVTITNKTRRLLTVTVPVNGRVTGPAIDCGGTQTRCAVEFPDGTTVELKAWPDAGHALGAWTGACSGRGGCGLTMDSDRSVGASFGVVRTLTVTAPTNGRVTGRIGAERVIDCGSDCSETVADGTVVTLVAMPASGHRFLRWGGACAAKSTADCALRLDGDRGVTATFAATAIDGGCDNSVRNGCASGTPNAAAVADTDQQYRWRCDGIGGGADSGLCGKAKAGCASGARSWSVGGTACLGSVGAVGSGRTSTATDDNGPALGSATFKCDDGAWSELSGGTCGVALRCGALENSCSPAGATAVPGFPNPPVHGACNRYGANNTCDAGVFDDLPDYPSTDGACGDVTNTCSAGTVKKRPGPPGTNLWDCLGITGLSRWNCTGRDGSKNWRCVNGSREASCSIPAPGGDLPCRFSLRATDDRGCFTCESTYESCGGGCVAQCGAHELLNKTSCECVCEEGYHRHNGACVKDPSCPDSSGENRCLPSNATAVPGPPNPPVHGACGGGANNSCDAGDPHDLPDAPPTNGMCGDLANTCEKGTLRDRPDPPGTNLWDCLGISGSSNWKCTGRDGSKGWRCVNGSREASCGIPDPGGTAACAVPISATDDTGCFTCESTYETCGGGCVAQCGAHELRNKTSCKCECKPGFTRRDGQCLLKLTIVVKQPSIKVGGRVTGTVAAQNIDCRSTCTYYVPQGSRVDLSASVKSGYQCDNMVISPEVNPPVIRPGQTSSSDTFYMRQNTSVHLNCDTTLKAEAGGPYRATFHNYHTPFGRVSYYSANVTASATGGVTPYKYRWDGHQERATATAMYIFATTGTHRKSVAVRDKDDFRKSDTADIIVGVSGGGGGGGAGAGSGTATTFAFEVARGGELFLVWGEDSDITATSGDTTVVTVSVASPTIRVAGVGVGRTVVIVRTDVGELRLPVVVK